MITYSVNQLLEQDVGTKEEILAACLLVKDHNDIASVMNKVKELKGKKVDKPEPRIKTVKSHIHNLA